MSPVSTTTTARCILPDLLSIIGQKDDISEVEEFLHDPAHPLAISEKEHHEWIDAQPTFTPKEKKILKMARICLLTAKMYPFGTTHQLAVNNHYFMWTFIIDTVIDRESNSINDQVGKVYLHILDTCGDLSALSEEEKALPHVGSMADLAKRTLPHLGPYYRDMYIASLADYMHARIRECRTRRRVTELQEQSKNQSTVLSLHDPRVPALSADAYLKNRRESVGTRAGLDILRWVHDIQLTPEELTDQRFRTMITCAGEFTSLINDLFSFKKEFLDGPFHPVDNYIWVSLHDPSTGIAHNTTFNQELQAGADCLAKAYTASYQVFMAQVDSLLNDPPKCVNGREGFKEDVSKYALKILECSGATLTWSTDASHVRYSVYKTPEARKNRILEFDLPVPVPA